MKSAQSVPIDKIHVVNARARNKAKFLEIVENISKVGLKNPITVSRREGSDEYDLVCGQGRLEAFIACGTKEIPAMVDDISLEDGLLKSLIENLTRRTRSGVEMVGDLVTMKERGHSAGHIATQIGKSETYVTQLLRLMENGERRLIAAVDRREIPITTAIEIASCDDAALQRSLQQAYEEGHLRGKALQRVRKLIEERRVRGKELGGSGSRSNKGPSTHDLVRTLRKETQRQELLVKKARLCEQQLRFVLSALKDLMRDENFVTLLRAEKLDVLPRHLGEMIQK